MTEPITVTFEVESAAVLEDLYTALLRASAAELSEMKTLGTQATVYHDRPRAGWQGTEADRAAARRARARDRARCGRAAAAALERRGELEVPAKSSARQRRRDGRRRHDGGAASRSLPRTSTCRPRTAPARPADEPSDPAPPLGRSQRGGRPRRGRWRGAAPPDRDRPAGRRSRPHRGRAGNGQDAARASDRAVARARDEPDPGDARPPARGRHRLEPVRGRNPSVRARARSSRMSSSSTRSIGRPRERSRPCSRRCRSARSPSKGRRGRCRIRSSCSRRRIRSSSRERSRFHRPSSTGSWSAPPSAIRPRPPNGRSPADTRRAAEPLDAIEPVSTGPASSACATTSAGSASPTKSRHISLRSFAPLGPIRTSSSAPALARPSRSTVPRRRSALLDGSSIRLAGRRQDGGGPGPRAPADPRLRSRSPRGVSRRRSWPRSSATVAGAAGRRSRRRLLSTARAAGPPS